MISFLKRLGLMSRTYLKANPQPLQSVWQNGTFLVYLEHVVSLAFVFFVWLYSNYFVLYLFVLLVASVGARFSVLPQLIAQKALKAETVAILFRNIPKTVTLAITYLLLDLVAIWILYGTGHTFLGSAYLACLALYWLYYVPHYYLHCYEVLAKALVGVVTEKPQEVVF